MMMEDNIDVDDLFGDPGSLELSLPAPPPAKGLAQRLDELRLLGCCRYGTNLLSRGSVDNEC